MYRHYVIMLVFITILMEQGIFFIDEYFWHIQRRSTLRSMRDYGYWRRNESLETCISSDIKEMIDLAKYGFKYPAEAALVKGDLLYLQHFFAAPFINGMLHIFARNPLPRSQYHELWELARYTLRFQRGTNDLGGALSYTPWLKDVMPKFSGYKDLITGNQRLLDLFHKLITEAMSTYDKSDIRHFLDAYICKTREETKISNRTTFSAYKALVKKIRNKTRTFVLLIRCSRQLHKYFRPERFIEDGKLKLSNDKSLPFGAGKRICAGETYARQMAMFQVFSTFMQAFHVSTVDVNKAFEDASSKDTGYYNNHRGILGPNYP